MAFYIDNAERRKLVATWIPWSLFFLHVWGFMFAASLVMPAKYTGFRQTQLQVIEGAFATCGWSIFALVLILASDKALDAVLSRFSSMPQPGQVVETKETKTTVIPAPVANPTADAQNVDITAENVNVDTAKTN